MKTKANSSPTIASPEMTVTEMGMDASGMQTAAYFMRDKIYTDKELAVCREYLSNAIDEHKKHKISRPVEIGLRSEEDGVEFFVRDFAKGLSEHHVRTIFAQYFKSTKSDENESIGGFGIGSKAGHCYSNTFYIRSFFEGVNTLYSCVLGAGNKGIPVGQVFEVTSEPTTESGIEIFQEVEARSEQAFIRNIKKLVRLSPNNVIASIFNVEVKPFETKKIFQSGDIKIRVLASDCGMGEGTVDVQMGGISYAALPVPIGVTTRAGFRLSVDIPVGRMELPLSRQEFEKTEANGAYLTLVKEAILSFVNSELDKDKPKDLNSAIKKRREDGKTHFEGQYFKYPWTLAAGDKKELQTLFLRLRFRNGDETACLERDAKNANKINVVIVPNNQAKDYWIDKLAAHCNEKKVNYAYVVGDLPIEINEVVNVLPIKKVPFKKGTMVGGHMIGSFAVYRKGLRNSLSRSPIEFHNMMMQENGWVGPEAKDIKEAQAQHGSFITACKIKNLVECHKQVIGFKVNINSYYSNSFSFEVRSAKALAAMSAIGWLFNTDEEYKKKKSALEKIQNYREVNFAKVVKAKDLKVFLSPKSQAILSKFANQSEITSKAADRCKSISDLVYKIKIEDTIRGKFVKTLDNLSSWHRVDWSRAEVRQILKLK